MTKVVKKVKTTNQGATVADSAIIGEVSTASQKKPSPMSLKVLVLGGIVLLLIFVLGWFLLRNATAVKTACGDDIVNSYNSLSVYAVRDESEDLTVDIEGLRALAGDIVSKDGYQDDPTCQTILLEIALYNDDYTSANDALMVIKELEGQNKHANSSIDRLSSLPEYETYVKQIEPSTDEETQEPQGGE